MQIRVYLLLIILILGSCKLRNASQFSDFGAEELNYPSEDVKWYGYFVGFALSQAPFSNSERFGQQYQYGYNAFLNDLRKSDCGSRPVPENFFGFYAYMKRFLPTENVFNKVLLALDATGYAPDGTGKCDYYIRTVTDALVQINSRRGASLDEL